MNVQIEPATQNLVLIGGGHTHAIALRLFGMQPLPGVRLTLISESSESAYSGMLPGRIAGFYRDEDCHINLAALANRANAQFYVDRVIGLDVVNRKILCDRHPPVAFDVVSIDIGSTPSLPDNLCTDEAGVIPIKPVRPFLNWWDTFLAQVAAQPERKICLAIVGGGAAGVELALTMQARIHQILQAAQQPLSQLELHLIHRGERLVPQFNARVSQLLRSLLAQRRIHVHLQETVQTVASGRVCCQSGLELACDSVIWTTQATASPWLAATDLRLDEQGFILVNDALQSCSHPYVFAVGDIATMMHHPRPKAGVFAVRQGKPLAQNLRRFVQGQPLKSFHPQKQYLSLINTADGSAIAVKGCLSGRSPWLWRWKDHIDRQFMARFTHLPQMSPPAPTQQVGTPPVQQSFMPCAGCGSKVGSTILSRVLQRLQPTAIAPAAAQRLVDVAVLPDPPPAKSSTILIGLQNPDDAAVIQVPPEQVVVQTVDYFAALVTDPFLFGQISTHHALSDVYAMGAAPHSALAIATIPYGSAPVVEEVLYQLLAGSLQVLQEAGAELIGGHTTEGPDLAFGLSCNGLAHPDHLWLKSELKPGQALILTKSLGTGTLFAANMRGQALGRWLDVAVESMLRSNRLAAQCFRQFQATACTDVTGFGLVAHLREMIRTAAVGVTVHLEDVPVLPGALALAEQGVVSSLYAQNRQASQWIGNWAEVADHPKLPILFDPQTSGGLLAAVPAEQAADCVNQLRQMGYGQSAIVATTHGLVEGQLPIAIA